MTTPEWITKHDGQLKSGTARNTWFVVLDGTPQYRLFVTPAGGTFTCAVTQTNSGKRLDSSATYATPDAALAGGLNDLGKALGWL
jgi:hypothetical protein